MATGSVLFCLPYAGGGASAYREVKAALAGMIEVVAIQLPGRENRIEEEPGVDVAEIVDEIVSYGERPYAIYGHSMGARIGFEVVRELRRRGHARPRRFYVGAAHPPDRRVPLAVAVELPDEAFVEQLITRAGALPELRDEPELRQLVLPALRADFAWIRAYRYTPEPPLDVPIVAFAGQDDTEVPAHTMLGWARHTVNRFQLRTLPGGHMFVTDPRAELARRVAADLADGGEDALEDDELQLWAATGEPIDRVSRIARSSTLVHGLARCDGLALAAAARQGPVGVAVEWLRGNGSLDIGVLHPDEREQIDCAAEEDRPWLAARALTAKRAVASASGVDVATVVLPDIAAPGRIPVLGNGCTSWIVTHLNIYIAHGEALAAVVVSNDRTRLRFDLLTESSR